MSKVICALFKKLFIYIRYLIKVHPVVRNNYWYRVI
jgi:hypothetical protein